MKKRKNKVTDDLTEHMNIEYIQLYMQTTLKISFEQLRDYAYKPSDELEQIESELRDIFDPIMHRLQQKVNEGKDTYETLIANELNKIGTGRLTYPVNSLVVYTLLGVGVVLYNQAIRTPAQVEDLIQEIRETVQDVDGNGFPFISSLMRKAYNVPKSTW